MTYEKFEKLFTLLYKQHHLQVKWCESIPHEIVGVFIHNSYVNSILMINDELLDNLFEDIYLRFDVHNLLLSSKETLEELLSYFKMVYFNETRDNSGIC